MPDEVFVFGCFGTGTTANKNYSGYPLGHTIDFAIDSVDGLNKKVFAGPTDTLARDVGCITVDVVLSALEEMCRGRKKFAFYGHSRGAVISIIAAAELFKVRQLVEQAVAAGAEIDLQQILESDPPPLIVTAAADTSAVPGEAPAAVPQAPLYPATRQSYQDSRERIAVLAPYFKKPRLLDSLRTHQVGLFLLDPVPGGNWMKFPSGWRDPRQFRLTPNVALCNYVVAWDERSSPFKGSIALPLDSLRTSVQYYIARGHHGSMCGSVQNQLNTEQITLPKDDKPGLLSVRLAPQRLALLLLDGFNKAFGVKVDYLRVRNRIGVVGQDYGREDLAKLLHQFSAANVGSRQQQLHAVYEQMCSGDADDYFKQFQRTNYGLGGEFHFSLGEDYSGLRLMHIGSGADSHISMLPGVSAVSENFLDAHHQALDAELRNQRVLAELRHCEMHGATSMDELSALVKGLVESGGGAEDSPERTGAAKAAVAGTVDAIFTMLMNNSISVERRKFAYLEFVILREYLLGHIRASEARRVVDARGRIAAELQQVLEQQILYKLQSYVQRLEQDMAAMPEGSQQDALTRVAVFLDEALTIRKNLMFFIEHQDEVKKDPLILNAVGVQKSKADQIISGLQETIKLSLAPHLLRQDASKLTKQQKLKKVALLLPALKAYQHWMDEHTTGSRLANMCCGKGLHFYHGSAGRERVASLLEYHRHHNLANIDAGDRELGEFLRLVEQAKSASGSQRHSLSRYIYGALLNDDEASYDAERNCVKDLHEMGDFKFFLVKHGWR